jgi:hypothetical protein
MKKIILLAILISNISYGANTRNIPTSSKCFKVQGDLGWENIKYCEMNNGDVCYYNSTHKNLSCFAE